MNTKLGCDGRALVWEPQIETIFEPDEEPYDIDHNEPGFHAPSGADYSDVSFYQAMTKIMTTGRTCSWCEKYLPSPMEAVVENIFAPSPLLKFFKKNA